jgi:hypothetical protein
MNIIYYKQCVLERVNSPISFSMTTSWLPEEFATIGQFVKLKQEDGTWSDGWKVISANFRVEENKLPDPHREIKAHRRNTKDSEKS